jgi:nitrogen fixation/metabolism regulation signal transduction histidine kinase
MFSTQSIKRLLPLLGVTALLFLLLLIMAQSINNASEFAQSWVAILLIILMSAFALGWIIWLNFRRLNRQANLAREGARLTLRLMRTMTLVVALPMLTLFFFSIQFLNQGIDSWFDVKTEASLKLAVELSRESLELQRSDSLAQMQYLADYYQSEISMAPSLFIDQIRQQLNAYEVSLFDLSGQPVAQSVAQSLSLFPVPIPETAFVQVRQGGVYSQIENLDKGNSLIRHVIPLKGMMGQKRFMQALFVVPSRITDKMNKVASAAEQYSSLAFLRTPLKTTFIITLTLVLLLASLAAILLAQELAKGITQPVAKLSEATREIARGNYSTSIINHNPGDELGALVELFNQMTRQIALSRDEIKLSHQQSNTQKAFLETILANLNSGVWVIRYPMSLRTANPMSMDILEANLNTCLYQDIHRVSDRFAYLTPLVELIVQQTRFNDGDWQEELELNLPNKTLTLMVRGSSLPDFRANQSGFIIVFDDITRVIRARRDEAWNEVARRLAHEIKNPLTPIQLASERLRYKLAEHLQGRELDVLQKSTETIIAQVDALKAMVQAFSDYARMPKIAFTKVDLNALLENTANLYIHRDMPYRIQLNLDTRLEPIDADSGKLRQVLHNLIKNAIEAVEQSHLGDKGLIRLSSHFLSRQHVQILVEDNGPGIAANLINTLFEPYATTKTKGTGLGLAIVKKIIDDHGGKIQVAPSQHLATAFIIDLPTTHQDDPHG